MLNKIFYIWVIDADLSVLFLTLEFKFEVEKANGRVLKVLGLLLESSVGESLLECNSIYQKRILF